MGTNQPFEDGFYENRGWLCIAQGVNDSLGNVDYLTSGNNLVYVKPHPYTLGAQPYPWEVAAGTEILIDPACLSGYGATTRPIKLVSDGYVWMPAGEQLLYKVKGSYASPAATQGAINPAVHTLYTLTGGNLKINPLLLYLGVGLRIKAHFYKDDAVANASTFRVNMGNTNSAADDIMCKLNTSAAANSEVFFDNVVSLTKLGAFGTAIVTTPVGAKLNTSATKTANESGDKSGRTDSTANMYISFSSIPPNITATSALISFSVHLVP